MVYWAVELTILGSRIDLLATTTIVSFIEFHRSWKILIAMVEHGTCWCGLAALLMVSTRNIFR